MKFLWPAAWSLASLAIPVILFYLIRQRLRPRVVTTLLFWESLVPKVHNLPLWRRLRRIVSLLLQLLFLALVIMALARPAPPGRDLAAASTIIVPGSGRNHDREIRDANPLAGGDRSGPAAH